MRYPTFRVTINCNFSDNKELSKLFRICWRNIASCHKANFAMNYQLIHGKTMDHLKYLGKIAPAFPIDASKITLLKEPKDFYSTLFDKCQSAKKRITLASLYLGTGALEADLVKCMQKAVVCSNGDLEINILLDYMRGTRGKLNSRMMLEPLLEDDCAKSCKIHLYHTPRLRGLLKTVMPSRFNELIGLQHMKIYIFDDSLIISGANLSSDYFTNRQDRYFLIENCKDLCDFYNNLVIRVTELSFRLLPGNTTIFENSIDYHPLKSSLKKFSHLARKRIQSLYATELNKSKNEPNDISKSDTWIFPLIQMGQLNIRGDSEVTLNLLKTAPPGSILRLATSYFNLTSEYSNALLRDCQASCQLLTAHPTANGFFKAKGVAGGIPAAYTKMEKSFFQQIEKFDLGKRIELREFVRPDWTYHAKGLWYTSPNQKRPSLTLIGSSNFGYRSVERDLETQIAIVTTNEKLQKNLEEEYSRLYRRSMPVNKQSLNQPDRIVPVWVRLTATLFRYFF